MTRIFITLLCLIHINGFTQELTSVIRGTITDKQSGFTLPGVNVIVTSTDPIIGATTDIDGRFRLEEVPVGRHTIKVSFIGYESITLSNLMLNSAKELEVNAQIEESITELKEVVVTAQQDKKSTINEMSSVSARTFSIEEAARYSGALQDPSRMAQNFAGVSGASDDRNDIIIRGNSPTGVLWRLEGIDIPSPNHFSTVGTTGGPVSMLNINNLSNSDFATSAFAAEYGNALAGVFDLNLRNGNNDKREYLGQVGFNGFELGAEGPFKQNGKASYLLNYRYSTLGIFSALGVDLGTGAAVPEYQDLTFKINAPTNNNSVLSLFGVMGKSNIDFLAKDATSDNLYSRNREDARFKSQTAIVGASYKKFLNKNTSIKLTLASTHTQSAGSIENVDSLFIPTYVERAFDRTQDKISAHAVYNQKINAKNTLIIGNIYEQYFFDMLDSVFRDSIHIITTDSKENTGLNQTYVQWKHKFNDKITLNTGLHSQLLLLNSKVAIEPRLGLQYRPNARHMFSLGYGLHSQMQPVTVYFEEDENPSTLLPNKDLDFSKSHHFVVAHDYFFAENIRLKTEIYFQSLFHVPVDTFVSSFSMLNEGADFTLPTKTGMVNQGSGQNYGLEITLERFFNKGYYFLLTNSLFESSYKGSDEVRRNTIYNTGYVLNVLGGREFALKKQKSISFDTKVTYTGGRRYTPIDLTLSDVFQTEIRDESQAFSLQHDPYFRFDFKITFRKNGKSTAQQFSIDLQNLTGRQNVFLQEYNVESKQIETTYQRGFFPDVQYKIYF